jgi:hypothetical protein
MTFSLRCPVEILALVTFRQNPTLQLCVGRSVDEFMNAARVTTDRLSKRHRSHLRHGWSGVGGGRYNPVVSCRSRSIRFDDPVSRL